jgi:hypothetical protein
MKRRKGNTIKTLHTVITVKNLCPTIKGKINSAIAVVLPPITIGVQKEPPKAKN